MKALQMKIKLLFIFTYALAISIIKQSCNSVIIIIIRKLAIIAPILRLRELAIKFYFCRLEEKIPIVAVGMLSWVGDSCKLWVWFRVSTLRLYLRKWHIKMGATEMYLKIWHRLKMKWHLRGAEILKWQFCNEVLSANISLKQYEERMSELHPGCDPQYSNHSLDDALKRTAVGDTFRSCMFKQLCNLSTQGVVITTTIYSGKLLIFVVLMDNILIFMHNCGNDEN
jgi:hypothetical protein